MVLINMYAIIFPVGKKIQLLSNLFHCFSIKAVKIETRPLQSNF